MGMKTVSPTWDNLIPLCLPQRLEQCSAHSKRLTNTNIIIIFRPPGRAGRGSRGSRISFLPRSAPSRRGRVGLGLQRPPAAAAAAAAEKAFGGGLAPAGRRRREASAFCVPRRFPSGAAAGTMAFRCQRDSYARELATTVLSCLPAEQQLERGGRPESLTGFHVLLADTVLFPEGGGQPDDRGFIDEVPVLRVIRRGPDACHFVRTALEPGRPVHLRLDWPRRFDHMQQHSGQHLITAVADLLFGLKTTSWELGKQRSVIELDAPELTPAQVVAIEQEVNEKIRARVPVSVKELEATDPEVEKVRSRGLPDDHAGPIRVVNIEGLDSNLCCGTHVCNLAELQVIKLLGVEKGKKNRTNLVFLAGGRVLQAVERSYGRERALTGRLKCGPEEHVEAVEKLQASTKLLQKNNLSLLRDLAVLTAQNFKNSPNPACLFVLHRKDGDSEFMNIVANEIGTEKTLLFLTVGDEKGAGLFLLAGPPEAVNTLGPRAAELLQGRGAGKPGRFQGKATKLSQRAEVLTLLRDFVHGQGAED
uniref:Alanyl-tRNA synthetase domain containing 1 n=2 Tax=Ornithorhynchus anatinus TaxID=9258 RepID=F6S764_ORNAN